MVGSSDNLLPCSPHAQTSTKQVDALPVRTSWAKLLSNDWVPLLQSTPVTSWTIDHVVDYCKQISQLLTDKVLSKKKGAALQKFHSPHPEISLKHH